MICFPSLRRIDYDEAYDLAFLLFPHDCDAVMRWFGSPNPELDNKQPLELMREGKCDAVIAFLKKQLAKTP